MTSPDDTEILICESFINDGDTFCCFPWAELVGACRCWAEEATFGVFLADVIKLCHATLYWLVFNWTQRQHILYAVPDVLPLTTRRVSEFYPEGGKSLQFLVDRSSGTTGRGGFFSLVKQTRSFYYCCFWSWLSKNNVCLALLCSRIEIQHRSS